MIEIEQLAALDLCAWTGSQAEAAMILKSEQSTISRSLHKTKRLLESIGIKAVPGKKYLFQDVQDILKSQRKLHQQIRFTQARDLRIQATCWARHLLLDPTPDGWIPNRAAINNFKHRDTQQLLEQHIIDAALVTGPDAPSPSEKRYARYHLSNQPLFLLIPHSNKLALEHGLSPSEVASHTELGHSNFVSKECRAVMEVLDKQLFGAQDHQPFTSYKEPPNHARRYGTAMTMLIRPDLTRLGVDMRFPAADILIVRQELADHPEILRLVFALKTSLADLQHSIPDLEVMQ